MHQRREFRTRRQQLYEPSANFITSMRAILRKSNQTLSEAEAVDFILGNMTPQLAERIIPMNPRTYANLKTFANLVEQGMKAAQEMTSGSTDNSVMAITESINKLSMVSKGKNPNNSAKNFNSRTKRGAPRCYFCGITGHVQTVCRKRLGQTQQSNNNPNRNFNNFNRNNSSSYRGRGNYRSRNNYRGNGQFRPNYNRQFSYNSNQYQRNAGMIAYAAPQQPDQPIHLLNIIGAIGINNGFYINVSINGITIPAILDTGAVACFINETYATNNNFPIQAWRGTGYTLANGFGVNPVGLTHVKLSLTLNSETKSAELPLYLIRNLSSNLVIGSNAIRALGIIINGKENTVSY